MTQTTITIGTHVHRLAHTVLRGPPGPSSVTPEAVQSALSADQAAGRAALALGTAATTDAIDYDPAGTAAWSVIAHESAPDPHSQYTTVSEAAAAAPVQSVAGRAGDVTLTTADISGSTATGRAVLTAADAAAARTVIGVAVTSDSAGNIKAGQNAQSSVTTGASNIGFGTDVQLSLTTGSGNVGLGAATQYALTTGNNNFGFGQSVQRYLTAGNHNIGLGSSAQYSLTTGSNNIGLGEDVQGSLTTGSSNIASGVSAQYSLTTGDSNIASGSYAQRYLNDGSDLTSANRGVFIGADTRASADGNVNETVIGAGARGNGSYTTTIGAPSQTACYISGVIVPTSYTVASLPLAPPPDCPFAYASNGRKSGEGAGAGTGVPVYYSAGKWRVYRDDSEVQA